MKNISTLIASLLFLLSLGFSQQIEAIKIGESSNAFSNVISHCPSVVCLPDVGNGVIATSYRQEILACSASTSENKKVRYSISTDGGMSWDVGADTVPPNFTGCYGKGPVYDLNTVPLSYPSIGLFSRGQVPTIDSLGMVYVGPAQGEAVGLEGYGHALVLDPAANPMQITDQGIEQGQGILFQTYSLTSQVDRQGEQNFWFTSSILCGSNTFKRGPGFSLLKGNYDADSREVDWQVHKRIDLCQLGGDPAFPSGRPSVAFDPSGQFGWMAIEADIAGGQDSVMAPIFLKSEDGGQTWSDPVELDLSKFVGLRQRMNQQTGKPTTGKISCRGMSSLTVDADGNPHFMVAIGSIDSLTFLSGRIDRFQLFFNPYSALYDITTDPCSGDWQLIYLDDLNARLAIFGRTGAPGSYGIDLDNFPKVSRSLSGEKIFYSWTDTDTTGRDSVANDAPDLKGKALDIRTELMTSVINWTENDSLWQGKILAPQTAALCLQEQDTFTLPTVAMTLDFNDALRRVSYWYFPGIRYEQPDFVHPKMYAYRCEDHPIVIAPQITPPACGQANGALSLGISGSFPPYQLQWGANANFSTSAALSNLPSAVYQLTITDSLGCEQSFELALNDIGAPQISIDSSSAILPVCQGDSNGSLAVLASGNGLNYLWSNGETQARASALSAGQQIVRVEDSSACRAFAIYKLEDPAPLSLTFDTKAVTCAFDRSGTALARGSGGHGGRYSYHWSTGWTGEKAAGLNAEAYTCTLTDQAGCQFTDTVEIPGPKEALRVKEVLTTWPIPCTGNNGTIAVTAAGGSPPYAFAWAHGSAGPFQFGMSQGLYQFQITDNAGCKLTDFAFLESHESYFPIIRAEITDSICSSDTDNRVKLYIDKGYGPFTYTWANGDTGAVLNNLSPGNYHCDISQAGGCDLEAHIMILPEEASRLDFAYAKPYVGPDGPMGRLEAVASKNVIPYEFSFQWASADSQAVRSGLAAGKYIASATDGRGCAVQDSFDLLPILPSLSIEAEISPDCQSRGQGAIRLLLPSPGTQYQVQWAHGPSSTSISGLSPGAYQVSILDTISNCPANYTYYVRNAPPLQLAAVIDSISCKGGSNGRIDLQVSGGSGFHHTLWSHGDSTDHLFDLPWGTYKAIVSDQNGCFQDSIAVEMAEIKHGLEVTATTTGDRPQHGYRAQLYAAGKGGTPPYSYLWNTTPPQRGDTVTRQPYGWYEVLLTDYHGCTASDSVWVETFLGIEDDLPFSLRCYPNPNAGTFWLEVKSDFPRKMELQVLDMQGKTLMEQRLGTHVELRQLVELGEVPVGMYFLQVKIGNRVWREKVLVGN